MVDGLQDSACAIVHEHGRSKHEAGPQCKPVPYFLSAKLSRRVGVIPARPSGGAGARRLVDQDVPGHGLYVLEQLATDLGYSTWQVTVLNGAE